MKSVDISTHPGGGGGKMAFNCTFSIFLILDNGTRLSKKHLWHLHMWQEDLQSSTEGECSEDENSYKNIEIYEPFLKRKEFLVNDI